MNYLSMSFLNLFRNKSKTFLTAMTLAGGVMMAFLLSSLIDGMRVQSVQIMKETLTGSGQIMSEDNFDSLFPSLEYAFDYSSFEKDLDLLTKRGVKWTPRSKAKADLIFYESEGFIEDGYRPMVLIGVDPLKDELIFPLEWVEEGFYQGEIGYYDPQPIYISEYLANKIKAQIGSPMLISLNSRTGESQAVDVVVYGIFNTPDSTTNRSHFFVNQDTLIHFLDFEEGQATELTFSKEINNSFSFLPEGIHFYSWQEIGATTLGVLDFVGNNLSILITFIFIIAAIGIINTTTLSVYERFKEIGTLRSFGMSRSEILSIFALEGFWIGIIGSLIGMILASLVNILFVNYGIDYSSWMDNLELDVFYPNKMKGTWSASFLLLPVWAISISVIFSFITARLAFKKSIVECLYG